jgi:hypothetical protein
MLFMPYTTEYYLLLGTCETTLHYNDEFAEEINLDTCAALFNCVCYHDT